MKCTVDLLRCCLVTPQLDHIMTLLGTLHLPKYLTSQLQICTRLHLC